MLQELANMKNDFKEDVRQMSQKLGESVLAHTDSLSTIKFHDNFLETLNEKVQDISCENKKKRH